MIIKILAGMLSLGLLGLVKLKMRYDRVLSWLMFFTLSYLFGQYINYEKADAKGFSLLWATPQIGNITIDFHPVYLTNQLIIPIFFISLLAILYNNIFRYEERRCPFNSFVIYNFLALSLLICSENYIQLITMVFVADIMGYLILRNVDSSHRYVIYNFFADMCLFMILALACGKIQSIEMTRLLGYEQIGRHKDFVSLVTSIAIFIKIGCFPFESYLMEISTARFQRMSLISILGAPLVGVLLLIKLHNFLLVSDLFLPLLNILSLLTFLYGIINFITKRDIRKKVISFNMASLGLLVYMLAQNNFGWDNVFSFYYLGIYLLNQLFFKIYLYQNRETDVTKMISAKAENSGPLKIILLQFCLINAIFGAFIWQIFQKTNNIEIMTAMIVMFISETIVLNHIYGSPLHQRMDSSNKNSWRFFAFVINFLLLFVGLYLKREYMPLMMITVIVFLSLIALPFGNMFYQPYHCSKYQDIEIGKGIIKYLLVVPLSYISRKICSLMDMFLSEKNITTALSGMDKSTSALSSKLNRHSFLNGIIMLIIMILVLVLSYYNGGNK